MTLKLLKDSLCEMHDVCEMKFVIQFHIFQSMSDLRIFMNPSMYFMEIAIAFPKIIQPFYIT